jgi:hypothetical protein
MSTKPDDIPQDVWDAALQVMREHHRGTTARSQAEWDRYAIIGARGIMAERDRCARIAESWTEAQQPIVERSKTYSLHDVADEIAASIRKGGA